MSRRRQGDRAWKSEPATVTFTDPVFETQPFEFVSTTESVRVPTDPAVYVIAVPVGGLVIVPFRIVHAYVEPAVAGTVAVLPVEPGSTGVGAVMTGAGGFGLTVTDVAADAALVQPLVVTLTV